MAESGDGTGLRAAGTTTLLTADGVELAARIWPSAHPADTIVVLVHGFAASKDHSDVVALAGRLRDRGIDVISYDARGHGDSGGSCTLGDLERHDVAAAVAWARERSSRVVLVGASMGGIAVLRHAATGADVAGVVAVSSPAEWRIPLRARAGAHHWAHPHTGRPVGVGPAAAGQDPSDLDRRRAAPGAGRPGDRARSSSSTANRTGSSRPAPALDIYSDGHGDGDRRLMLVPGMGHAFDPAGHDAICDAVDWVVARSPGDPDA